MKKLFKMATVAAALTFGTNVVNAADKIGFVDPNYLLQNHPTMLAVNEKVAQFMKENEAKFAAEDKALADEEKKLVSDRKKIDDDAKQLQQEQKNVEASMKKKIEALEKEAPRLRAKEIQARQEKINAEGKAFQSKVDALQKREAEFMKRADAFQAKAAAFHQKVTKAQQDSAGVDPNKLQEQAVEDINAAIKTVAEAKGYTLVFPPSVALYAKDEKADITEEVLAALKANAKPLEMKPAKVAEPAKADDATSVKPEEVKK